MTAALSVFWAQPAELKTTLLKKNSSGGCVFYKYTITFDCKTGFLNAH